MTPRFAPGATIVAAALWLALLGAPPAAAQQRPQSPQQAVQNLIDLLRTTSEGAATAAMLQVRQILDGLQAWTPQAWGDVVAVSEEFDVALDALVASVQGCLVEPGGRPIVGVPVIGQSVDTLLAPMLAMTSTETQPARLLLPGGDGLLAVSTDWLSERQRQSWGPGCYWIPMPPGGLTALGSGDSAWIVTPLVLGYEFQPGSKAVAWQGNEYVIVESGNPINPPTAPQVAD